MSALIPLQSLIPPGQVEMVEGNDEGSVGGLAVEQAYGGQTIPVTSGSVAAGITLSAGDRSSALPLNNPNLLWGAAAAAMLGATLAEWQKRRQEEEAARRAAQRADDIPDDVLFKRRAIVAQLRAERNPQYSAAAPAPKRGGYPDHLA